jgi:hypothetical protein
MRNARKSGGFRGAHTKQSGAPHRTGRRRTRAFSTARNLLLNEPGTAGGPSTEVEPIGPHPTDPDRDALGHWVKRNNGHLSHGAESEQRALMLAPARAAERAATLAGLGLTETSVTRPLSYAIDRLIEAHFIAQSYIAFLSAQGVITTKGRQRRAVEGWRKAADAVIKYAALVGLDRVERPTFASPREWLEAGLAETTDPEVADCEPATETED